MSEDLLKCQSFKLKGRLYTFTVLQVYGGDRSFFEQQLHQLVSKAPGLFVDTPIVLDCTAVDEAEFDLASLCELARQHGLVPIAIQSHDTVLNHQARSHGLAVLNASAAQDKPLLQTIKTRLLTTPVRSGQQVVSKSGDLVVTASVSHGAELLADGHIHIYGALRGRALAGLSGNKEARIFCQSLEAEMVAIAGFYLLSEEMEYRTTPCQVYLQDDQIKIESL